MNRKINLDQAAKLRSEASELSGQLFKMKYFVKSGDDSRVHNLLEKAQNRFRRRCELQADLKWPNRHKKQ